MNRAYISKLMELAECDRRVCHLVADSGTGFDEMFKKNFPNQMFNFGIAENNMVGAAAGMATIGEIPFVFTADAFLAYRSLEFIRNDVCYQNLNVKIVGMGSGISWSTLGPTHHTTEAIGMLRALPNLVILNPSTPVQVAKCVEYAYNYEGPVYIRIGMNNEKEFYDNNVVLSIDKNYEFVSKLSHPAYVVSIFSTGSILDNVMQVKEKLDNEGIGTNIIDCVCLKPFDEELVVKYAKNSDKLVSIEEHNTIGGLGTIIADTIAKYGIDCKIKKIGLKDTFAHSFGTIDNLRKVNALDVNSLIMQIRS